MMQLWVEDMIRFMRDASEYGTYNQELANLLAPELTRDMHICDAGCGLGYLSLALEFGQPFRSLADARRFYEIYSKDADKSLITDEFLLNKLESTGQTMFPYYMPHLRSLAILKFRAGDIPEQINR